MKAGGNFVRGEVFAAVVHKVLGAGIGGAQDDLGFDDFAEVRMGAAEDAGFADGRMAVKDGLDLLGEHFAAGEVDDGGFAGNEIEKAFAINAAEVAGDEPAVAQNVFAGLPRGGVGIANALSLIHISEPTRL